MKKPSMSVETEVKVRVSRREFDRVRARLQELQSSLVCGRQEEDNLLLDFPDDRLERAGCALRLRTYGPRSVLTFKGRVVEDSIFKKREEVETSVGDPAALRALLEALGMEVSFQYSKFREIYTVRFKSRPVIVCLDETPVGDFVELEGDEKAILQLATTWGWKRESFIRKSYVELYRDG